MMPREAKLGLALGVGLVILVAVVFFRKDALQARANGDRPAIAAKPPSALPVARGSKTHRVAEGETLFSLSRRYYNDSGRFVELYHANRGVLQSPEQLPPGTVLHIPDLPSERP